jgi:hypothetical protein
MLARQSLIRCRELGARRNAPGPLEGLAWVARVRGDLMRAVRLLGTAEAVVEGYGGPRHRSDQDRHGTEAAMVREQLGDEAFSAAWAEGRAMTLEQAVAYALEEPPSA